MDVLRQLWKTWLFKIQTRSIRKILKKAKIKITNRGTFSYQLWMANPEWGNDWGYVNQDGSFARDHDHWDRKWFKSERDAVQAVVDLYKKYMVELPHEDE